MSSASSLKELLARREGALEGSPASSASLAEKPIKHSFLLKAEKLSRPVEAARALKSHGLSLRKAHDAVNRLADKKIVAVSLEAQDQDAIVAGLAAVGVAASPIVSPKVDVKTIRDAFGISQSEFATRFGLELNSLRNWEQQRYQADPAIQLLLKVIERHPEAVEDVLAGAGRA
jgi:DNA-binding transcriptional regulator YiaG